jgi:hypothetical protein
MNKSSTAAEEVFLGLPLHSAGKVEALTVIQRSGCNEQSTPRTSRYRQTYNHNMNKNIP